MAHERLKTSAAGALIGCALGDAIGEIAFNHSNEPELRAAVERSEALIYTDDTAMAIGLAQSLIEEGAVEEAPLGRRFAENFAEEPWRGYGPGPPKIFVTARRTGQPYTEVARELYGGEGSLGNGAAMRVAPVGIAYREGRGLYEAACTSAALTHAHPVGQDGAAVQALAVAIATRHALAGERLQAEAVAEELAASARTDVIRQKMRLVARLLSAGAPPGDVADAVGRSVAVHESMPFAIYAFLRAPGQFRQSVECAILHGGDRDTLGAMTGAIAGAYLGVDALPVGWRVKVENGAYLEKLGRQLAEAFPAA